ncbi:MAG TPA: response regulator [Polyangiales bacterium]|nr:response regulator [Polyangiales bacterium]
MKRARIVLLDDDRVAARATQRRLLALEHTLIATVDRPADALTAIERDAPDLLLINARHLGERIATKIARDVSQRFATPCLLQSGTPPKSKQKTASEPRIHRIHDVQQLNTTIQIALFEVELEREQRHAIEADARAAEAQSAIRNSARLVHQLNNLLSAIRCNAFLMQSETDRNRALSEASRDITIAVERSASIMAELTALVRASGPHDMPLPLPVSLPPEPMPTRPARVRISASGSRNVLVVDDDQVVHRALTRFLTRRGYRILAARTPAEALFIARHEQIAVVITDLVMPEMTGYELAARIDRLQPGVRVIYMSGYAPNGSDTPGGDSAPMLQKPFDVEDLVKALSAALTGRDRDVNEATPARSAGANNEP